MTNDEIISKEWQRRELVKKRLSRTDTLEELKTLHALDEEIGPIDVVGVLYEEIYSLRNRNERFGKALTRKNNIVNELQADKEDLGSALKVAMDALVTYRIIPQTNAVAIKALARIEEIMGKEKKCSSLTHTFCTESDACSKPKPLTPEILLQRVLDLLKNDYEAHRTNRLLKLRPWAWLNMKREELLR